jgi:predicted N-acetyltransferase YhbS
MYYWKLMNISLFALIQKPYFYGSSAKVAKLSQQITSRKFGTYTIRHAEIEDIPFIRNCNLATLPENYNAEFYSAQLGHWPDLSLICEDSSGSLVGYVLGRTLCCSDPIARDPAKQRGHVASISVLGNHRGNKIASNLMRTIHDQFKTRHVDRVNLFCRVSYKSTCLYRLFESIRYLCLCEYMCSVAGFEYSCHKFVRKFQL